MMMRKLFRNLKYFCNKNQIIENQGYQVPEFDENLFNQVNDNYKSYSGYAFLDIEPFPRLKIAKIAYIVLEKIKVCPEDSNYRMFTEEYMKYLINKCIEIKNIEELEIELNTDSIEDFISNLSNEIKLVDEMFEDIKPWEKKEDIDSDDDDKNFMMALKPVVEDKLRPAIEYKPSKIDSKFLK